MKGGKKAVMTALAVILVVFMSFPTVFAARAAEAVPERGRYRRRRRRLYHRRPHQRLHPL